MGFAGLRLQGRLFPDVLGLPGGRARQFQLGRRQRVLEALHVPRELARPPLALDERRFGAPRRREGLPRGLRAAGEAALAAVVDTEAALSRFVTSSFVARLNRTAPLPTRACQRASARGRGSSGGAQRA